MEDISHRPLRIIPIILVPVVWLVMVFFNFLAASNFGQQLGEPYVCETAKDKNSDKENISPSIVATYLLVINATTILVINGIFNNNTGEVARNYDTEIQPAGWAFSIWGVIYTWQALWIIYSLTTIGRRGINGYLYYSPPILHPMFYILYAVNNVLNISWLLTWDRLIFPAALAFLALMTFSLYLCMLYIFQSLGRYEDALFENGKHVDVWCMRILVQNGIGIYTTWVTIATLVNLSVVLVYDAGMANIDASTICLSILSVEIALWVSADTFLLDKYTRYLITPHCVIVFTLSAVIAKNYVRGARNSIISAVLLAVGIAALLSKIVLMVIRHIKSRGNRKVDFTGTSDLAMENMSYGKF